MRPGKNKNVFAGNELAVPAGSNMRAACLPPSCNTQLQRGSSNCLSPHRTGVGKGEVKSKQKRRKHGEAPNYPHMPTTTEARTRRLKRTWLRQAKAVGKETETRQELQIIAAVPFFYLSVSLTRLLALSLFLSASERIAIESFCRLTMQPSFWRSMLSISRSLCIPMPRIACNAPAGFRLLFTYIYAHTSVCVVCVCMCKVAYVAVSFCFVVCVDAIWLTRG